MTCTNIHPTAIIDPKAELANDVTVGPYSLIGPDVKIDSGTSIGSHVVITGHTSIGKHNQIFQFSSLGEAPQDKKYQGEPTKLEIGDHNTIREFCTFNRGTSQDKGATKIGNHNWIMAYVHIAHDCHVHNNTILANNSSLAGHVDMYDYAILGGFTLVHQFTQIGQYSFAAMGSAITQDIPPFIMVGGKPTRPHGINSVGMERNGISAEDIRLIRKAYKIIYKMNLRLEDAIDQMEDLAGDSKELSDMVSFLRNVSRGILR